MYYSMVTLCKNLWRIYHAADCVFWRTMPWMLCDMKSMLSKIVDQQYRESWAIGAPFSGSKDHAELIITVVRLWAGKGNKPILSSRLRPLTLTLWRCPPGNTFRAESSPTLYIITRIEYRQHGSEPLVHLRCLRMKPSIYSVLSASDTVPSMREFSRWPLSSRFCLIGLGNLS